MWSNDSLLGTLSHEALLSAAGGKERVSASSASEEEREVHHVFRWYLFVQGFGVRLVLSLLFLLLLVSSRS